MRHVDGYTMVPQAGITGSRDTGPAHGCDQDHPVLWRRVVPLVEGLSAAMAQCGVPVQLRDIRLSRGASPCLGVKAGFRGGMRHSGLRSRLWQWTLLLSDHLLQVVGPPSRRQLLPRSAVKGMGHGQAVIQC